MGGHSSKQTVSASTTVAANIVQATAQSCIGTSQGSNSVNVGGVGNTVDGVTQSVSLSVNMGCSTFSGQDSTFNNDLQNSLSQVLNDQGVALTQWMDGSRSDQASSIRQDVTTNFTQENVQNIVQKLNGYNVLNVQGVGNTVKDVAQTAALSVIATGLQQNGQTNAVVNSITNTVNQHGQYKSANPLAFITDAIQSSIRTVGIAIIAVIVILICFVLLVVALRRSRKPAATAAQTAEPAATAAAPAGPAATAATAATAAPAATAAA